MRAARSVCPFLMLTTIIACNAKAAGVTEVCNGDKYMIFNNNNFTYAETVKTVCNGNSVITRTDAGFLYTCKLTEIAGNRYWTTGGSQHCSDVLFVDFNPQYKDISCTEQRHAICKVTTATTTTTSHTTIGGSSTSTTVPSISGSKPVHNTGRPGSKTTAPTLFSRGPMKTPVTSRVANGTSTTRWQKIKYNNTFIHVITENLTQTNAIASCNERLDGSLLHMTLDIMFVEMKRITTEGMYWIDDYTDTNDTDDCLVFTRNIKGNNSIRAVQCDERHYTLCQSVADHDLLLNSAFFEDILDDLAMKNETSKDFRAKNSIWDDRVSSHIVGGSGLVFMVIFAGIVGLWDLPYLKYICLYFTRPEEETDDD